MTAVHCCPHREAQRRYKDHPAESKTALDEAVRAVVHYSHACSPRCVQRWGASAHSFSCTQVWWQRTQNIFPRRSDRFGDFEWICKLTCYLAEILKKNILAKKSCDRKDRGHKSKAQATRETGPTTTLFKTTMNKYFISLSPQ